MFGNKSPSKLAILTMDIKRQNVYDKLVLLAQKFENLEIVDGSITNSKSWVNIISYLSKYRESKTEYVKLYLQYLEPLITDWIEKYNHTDLKSRTLDNLIANSIYDPEAPSHETSLARIVFNDPISKTERFRSLADSIFVRIDVDENKDMVLDICGARNFGGNPAIRLSRFALDAIRKDPDHIFYCLKQYLALRYFSDADSVRIFLELASRDLRSVNVDLVTYNLLSKSIFSTYDIYLETAVRAGLTVVDDGTFKLFQESLQQELNILF